jgi:hypothetical protein
MRVRQGAVICVAAVLAGTVAVQAAARDRVVVRDGVRVQLPCGWHGRVLRDPGGSALVIQFASFRFRVVHGVDPIKAMRAGDVLVTLLRAGVGGRAGRPLVRSADFVPRSAATPRGHAAARLSFCRSGRCFVLTADFGRPPSAALVRRVNAVLATLRVARRG